MKTVVITVFEGCMAGAVAAPSDLFMTANLLRDRSRALAATPAFRVLVASADGLPVISGNGQSINAQLSFAEVGPADLIFVPGIFVESESAVVRALAHLGPLLCLLRRAHEENCQIATSCSGTFIVAEAGLLDDGPATTTWWLSDLFRTRYPSVRLSSKEIVVEAGRVVTSAAGASYLDLSLYLIHSIAGADLARRCAAYLCIDGPRESQQTYAIPFHRQRKDGFIEAADRWLRENIARKLDVTMLAEQLNVSSRTLIRRFKRSLDLSPSQYIQQIRMEHAKILLETTRLPISTVADRCGYTDEDAFRRAFRQCAALTPSAFRQRAKRL